MRGDATFQALRFPPTTFGDDNLVITAIATPLIIQKLRVSLRPGFVLSFDFQMRSAEMAIRS
jgi:hypothetical protein